MLCSWLLLSTSPTLLPLLWGAGYDTLAATSFLESSTGQDLLQQWNAASDEKGWQKCLNRMIPDMLLRCHGQSRKYWDTSGELGNI